MKNPAKYPIKVVQFGEGNFLRAFVDPAFQALNHCADLNAGIAIVQPIPTGKIETLKAQDGLFTVLTRGLLGGKPIESTELVQVVVKGVNPYKEYASFLGLARETSLEFVISNTTEAGIAYDPADRFTMEPPQSFPAKLTRFLFERFTYFEGRADKGLVIIPCELINHNAELLKSIVLKYAEEWNLGSGFEAWVKHSNSFHNSLVDRIVPGFPKDSAIEWYQKLGYRDQLLVEAETFFLWVIEGEELAEKLPFHKTDLDVRYVKNLQPFRTRKVRILNGAHTAMVPLSLMFGNQTVRETLENQFTSTFITEAIFTEILPTLEGDPEDHSRFARDVLARFQNPYINHYLSSIALNSISKFKVRVLPSLLGYYKQFDAPPLHLIFAFACLLRFYRGHWLNRSMPLNDDPEIIREFQHLWNTEPLLNFVPLILNKPEFWGEDLSANKSLNDLLIIALECIENSELDLAFASFKQKGQSCE